MELVLDTKTKELLTGLGTAFEEMKARQTTLDAEIKTLKVEDPLLKEVRDKWATEVAFNHETLTQLKNAQEQLETRLNRPQMFTAAVLDEDAKKRRDYIDFAKTRHLLRNHKGAEWTQAMEEAVDMNEIKAYDDAFLNMLRKGDGQGNRMTPEQVKALSVGQDPDGGFLVRPQWSARITTRVFETSPMRSLATVETISGMELKIPADPNEADAGWTGEQNTRTETKTPQIAEKSIMAHELYALAKATQTILEDAAIDIETWLSNKIADKFTRIEATAFVNGDGVGKPRGFLQYPDTVDATNSGTNAWGKIGVVKTTSAGAFTVSGLTKLVGALKDVYHPRSKWLIKRESMPLIMLLQDTAGRYIFQPIFSGGFNNQPLLGYPIQYAFDIPVAATNSYSAVFGDFAAMYTIVDRIGVTVLRDPFSYKPFVGFYTRKRVGGDVVDFDAVKLLQLAT